MEISRRFHVVSFWQQILNPQFCRVCSLFTGPLGAESTRKSPYSSTGTSACLYTLTAPTRLSTYLSFLSNFNFASTLFPVSVTCFSNFRSLSSHIPRYLNSRTWPKTLPSRYIRWFVVFIILLSGANHMAFVLEEFGVRRFNLHQSFTFPRSVWIRVWVCAGSPSCDQHQVVFHLWKFINI